MKKLFTNAFMVLLTVNMLAQAPEKISYQAVVRNASNALVVDTEVGIRIQILQGTESGTVVYAETQTPTTNTNGLISIEIGSGSILSGTIGSIDWSDGPYFIRTDIDPAGGTSYTITGISQIVSVPYALYASYAENLAGGYTETQGLADVLAIDNVADAQIKHVANPTHPQDVVTKAYTDIVLWASGVVPLHFSGLIADADGNIYKTVTIGTQTWMAENLRTSKFRDNTAISPVTGSTDWAALVTPGYCWYGNVTSNSAVAVACGALYNWHTVSTGKLCPAGWHVPTHDEFNTLVGYVGGIEMAGGKLKENGTKSWISPNTWGTNLSGFTGLPCGARNADGSYVGIGMAGLFWSSTENSATDGACGVLSYITAEYGDSHLAKEAGLSVRCIKD